MEILKIILVSIVGIIIFAYLKANNSELASLSAVACGILILLLTVDYVIDAFEFFKNMASVTGVDAGVFKLIIKIISISYLTDFASSLCVDLGSSSIAEKVGFAGRTMIFTLSIPIFLNLFNIISSLIK